MALGIIEVSSKGVVIGVQLNPFADPRLGVVRGIREDAWMLKHDLRQLLLSSLEALFQARLDAPVHVQQKSLGSLRPQRGEPL